MPRYLRELLNRRLDDGEPGPPLLVWLNGCADVQEILEREFGGRAVSEQNLSEWRQGGFKDWQRQQEACDHVRRLTDQAAGLDEAAEEGRITDRLASVFAVELFKLMEQMLEKSTDDKERLGYLQGGLREIRLLRRGDHSAARLQMETERWGRQMDREDRELDEQRSERSRNRLIDLAFSKFSEGTLAQMFGGGDYGESMAEMITRIKFDLPLDRLKQQSKTQSPANDGVGLDQTESNQIQPNRT